MNTPTRCPICGYTLSLCLCRFSESAREAREKNRQVVLDHLYLLSAEQLAHIIGLQQKLQTSYEDNDRDELLRNLQRTGSTATKAKEERVSVPLNHKYDIVAEKNSYIDPPEISVFLLEKQTGIIHQDICLARQNLQSADDTQLLVWSRADCEDYSHEFDIPIYQEEDDA
ncbi:MAG: hypothetical protein IKY16_06850 [Bacteroidales bacterium]|nr:hypothetical protein [Bacteroidales bacterium]